MSLLEKILSVDARLQTGAANLAHKANELVGIGNYELSSIMFGASAATAAYLLVQDVGHWNSGMVPSLMWNAMYTSLSVYKILENQRLRKKEEARQQNSGAASIDAALQKEKKSFVNTPFLRGSSAKFVFVVWGLFAAVKLSPAEVSINLALLAGHYLREVDYIGPTKRNKAYSFLANLVPKFQKPSYESPTAAALSK